MAEAASKVPVKTEEKTPELATALQAWRPLERLRREIDRLFEDFDRDFWRAPFRAPTFAIEPKATKTTTRSPRISAVRWGQVEVEGVGRFRDAKIFPGGAREWDWNETGTAHDPGILPADVAEVLAHGARVIVLSRGMLSRLRVAPQTLELLAKSGVEAHVLPTAEAVDVYNRLCGTQEVGSLIHTTC